MSLKHVRLVTSGINDWPWTIVHSRIIFSPSYTFLTMLEIHLGAYRFFVVFVRTGWDLKLNYC